jgi:hypothetical protein
MSAVIRCVASAKMLTVAVQALDRPPHGPFSRSFPSSSRFLCSATYQMLDVVCDAPVMDVLVRGCGEDSWDNAFVLGQMVNLSVRTVGELAVDSAS